MSLRLVWDTTENIRPARAIQQDLVSKQNKNKSLNLKRRKKRTEVWEGGGKEKGREGDLEGRKEREKRKVKDQKKEKQQQQSCIQEWKRKSHPAQSNPSEVSTAHINVTVSTIQ